MEQTLSTELCILQELTTGQIQSARENLQCYRYFGRSRSCFEDYYYSSLLENHLGIPYLCPLAGRHTLHHLPSDTQLQPPAQQSAGRETTDRVQTRILHQHLPRIPYSLNPDSRSIGKDTEHRQSPQRNGQFTEGDEQEHPTHAPSH